MQAFDLMVADRYAEDGIVSHRVVREHYRTPPPKPTTIGANGRRTTVAGLRSEGAAATRSG